MSPDEWDALPLREQEAVAWWQFVESTGYKPLTSAQIAAIPLTGGQRTKAVRQMERTRAALMPED